MSLYTSTQVQNLLNKYVDKHGDYVQVEEGSLGMGDIIAFGSGLKTAIIKEVYINAWSSGHTIRMYNKVPKKYVDILDRLV